jgi:hypothetical protein
MNEKNEINSKISSGAESGKAQKKGKYTESTKKNKDLWTFLIKT